MKVRRLKVQNFRAIDSFVMDDIDDAVVVAGPNGAGKSHVYHALRLLKSMHGEYHQNELQQWFAEFKLNVKAQTNDLRRLFRDENRELVIEATFEFSDEEIEAICEPRQVLLGRKNNENDDKPLSPSDIAPLNPQQRAALEQWRDVLRAEAEDGQRTFSAGVRGTRDPRTGQFTLEPVGGCHLLEVAFTVFDPSRIGIIDYYGPQRVYNREGYGNLRIDLRDAAHGRQQYRGKAMTNYTAKFSNIKQELARAYVKGLLEREAGVEASDTVPSRIATMEKLFATFFPHKSFAGPQPTLAGALEFRVKDLVTSVEYDIDELSSGEKELLFGYLTIYNAAPTNSVVLIDEPELHLNPAMLRGLVRFYRESFGEALGGQVWLITHSDTIIREAAEDPNYSVFHLRRAGMGNAPQQVTRIGGRGALQAAMIDLVGDLAQFDPYASHVVLEGGGDTALDARVVRDLFPDFARDFNLISGGSKASAKLLRQVLEQASTQGPRFFAVVDRDDRAGPTGYRTDSIRVFQWDRYHIENYLLDETAISEVMSEAQHTEMTTEEVAEALKDCANARLDGLVRHRVQAQVRQQLLKLVKVSAVPANVGIAQHYGDCVQNVAASLSENLPELSPEKLQEAVDNEREALAKCCTNEEWRSTIPGREILLEFVSRHCQQLKYSAFRNLVLASMARNGRRPEGMESVLEEIRRIDAGQE